MPTEEVSTEPVIEINDVRSPSTSSVAAAPGSVKVSPSVRLMVEEPVKLITGGVVSSEGFTITVLVVETILLALSDTL